MKRGKGIKIGVIGLGSMGQHHARIASSLPGAKLAGVADINLSLAEETGRKFNAPAFEDYRNLLPLVDAVCLVTPTKTHFQIANECLSAKRHLLIEKPFTGQSNTAENLIRLAKETQTILAINLIERFNPAFQKLLKLLKKEKIHGVDIKRLSPLPERISDTNVIFDMMFHDLDLFHMIVPDKIESIRAEGENVKSKMLDRVVATFTHTSGIITRIEASRIFGIKSRKITVATEKHLIDVDLMNRLIYLRDFSSPHPSTLPVKKTDQLAESLNNFISVIKGKAAPRASAEDALNALLLAERIEKECL